MTSFDAGWMAKIAGLSRQATVGALGERYRAAVEGRQTAREMGRSMRAMATKSPIASLPERYNLATHRLWIRGGRGMGKTKPFLGNVGRAVGGVVRNLPR